MSSVRHKFQGKQTFSAVSKAPRMAIEHKPCGRTWIRKKVDGTTGEGKIPVQRRWAIYEALLRESHARGLAMAITQPDFVRGTSPTACQGAIICHEPQNSTVARKSDLFNIALLKIKFGPCLNEELMILQSNVKDLPDT